MFHSVILAHRNRNAHLRHCLWSIDRSARECGISAFEVIVVDSHSSEVPEATYPGQRVISDPAPLSRVPLPKGIYKVFNKPRAQNIGIEAARGDVLTFLDADAIVGKRWMESAERLPGMPKVTRLCYRVRLLPFRPDLPSADSLTLLDTVPDRADLLDLWFDHQYQDRYALSTEMYGEESLKLLVLKGPQRRTFSARKPIFGNSQFSITRKKLGSLRYNEDFAGRGFEDLWLIREIWRRHGKFYRGKMITDPDHAMFHLCHDGGADDWNPAGMNTLNSKRYSKT